MKRIIISLLVVLLTFSAISGYSEATDPGQEIFEKLADIYDTSLYYLNTWEEIWGTLINEKVENVSSLWFGKRFVTTSFGTNVAMFTVSNGYDDPYQDIFLPLLHYVGRSDEGLLKASYLFTYMVFFDEDMDTYIHYHVSLQPDILTASIMLKEHFPDRNDTVVNGVVWGCDELLCFRCQFGRIEQCTDRHMRIQKDVHKSPPVSNAAISSS